MRRLERDVFTHIGRRPIPEITPPELLAVVRGIESRTLDTAHRALRSCGQVFRYGIATGRCERDSSRDLKGALAPIKEIILRQPPSRSALVQFSAHGRLPRDISRGQRTTPRRAADGGMASVRFGSSGMGLCHFKDEDVAYSPIV